MESKPGTYALILKSRSNARIQIGRWGRVSLKPGYYIYVGSAFGPGGVNARVSRHYQKIKNNHWHIDYLRKFVKPCGVWYSYEPVHLEHQWAQAFHNMNDMTPVKGFGSSDCKCYSHLFWTFSRPDVAKFLKNMGEKAISLIQENKPLFAS